MATLQSLTMSVMLRDTHLLIEQAANLATKDRYEEALEILDGVLEEDRGNAAAWQARGYVNQRNCLYNEAIQDFSQAISLKGDEPHPYFIRAQMFLRLNLLHDALKDCTKVLELCDFYQSDYYREAAYFLRADVDFRLGRIAACLADLENVRDKFKSWTDRLVTKETLIYQCRSKVRSERGKPNRSEPELKATSPQPSPPEAERGEKAV